MPQQQVITWIPTSERMPTRLTAMLVTHQAPYSARLWLVSEALYTSRGRWWSPDGDIANVIAWAELPAPYQPNED